MIKKGLKFQLNTVEVEIISASNSEKTNKGICLCKTHNCQFKLHYLKIKELLWKK